MGLSILDPNRRRLRHVQSGRTAPNPEVYRSQGRPWRRPAGGWMADLAALKQTILLCSGCAHKFDFKRAHYFREGRFEAIGGCDGCVTHYGKVVLFVHQSYLGQSWSPD
ncbi:MAG: hypothetical protein ACYSUN_03295 [Planctomycetota bacterium]|jgi:hypothetical protein